MVVDFVLQNSHEPAFFRAAALKSFSALECSQKGFLNRVLGLGRVAQPCQRIFEKIVAVRIHPPFWIRKSWWFLAVGGFIFCLHHACWRSCWKNLLSPLPVIR